MRRALVLLAMALAACAGSPPPGAPSAAPVATVVLASPAPPSPAGSAIADGGAPDALSGGSLDAAPPAAAAALARPYAVRPGCDATAMDLETAQRGCACPSHLEVLLADAGAPTGPRCLPLDAADEQRIPRDVSVHVTAPPRLAPGAGVSLDVRIQNGGTDAVPLVFVNDEHPEVVLADAQGHSITAIVDPSCKPVGMLRMAPVSLVVVPPGGVVHASVPFQAVRWRSVGSTWRAPAKRAAGRKRSPLEEQLDALAAQDDGACKDVPDGPLPRGDYSVEVRLPLMPQDLASRVVGRASIHVQ